MSRHSFRFDLGRLVPPSVEMWLRRFWGWKVWLCNSKCLNMWWTWFYPHHFCAWGFGYSPNGNPSLIVSHFWMIHLPACRLKGEGNCLWDMLLFELVKSTHIHHLPLGFLTSVGFTKHWDYFTSLMCSTLRSFEILALSASHLLAINSQHFCRQARKDGSMLSLWQVMQWSWVGASPSQSNLSLKFPSPAGCGLFELELFCSIHLGQLLSPPTPSIFLDMIRTRWFP